MEIVAKKIRDLTKANRLQEACELLIKSPLSKEGYTQSGRLYNLEEKTRTGQLSHSDSVKEANQIRAALIEAAEILEKSEKNLKQKEKGFGVFFHKNKVRIILILVLGGLLSIAQHYFFMADSNAIPPSENHIQPKESIKSEEYKVPNEDLSTSSESPDPKIDKSKNVPAKVLVPTNDIDSTRKTKENVPISHDSITKLKIDTIRNAPQNNKYFTDAVFVKSAKFWFGDSLGDYNQKPEYLVQVSDFYIGGYEVTCAQFVDYLNVSNISIGHAKSLVSLDYYSPIRYSKKSKKYEVRQNYDNYPIRYLSWNGANSFCQSMSNEMFECRLPTEAEWEYAALGGAKHSFSQKNNNTGNFGWFNIPEPRPVGKKPGNSLGLHDMLGNVAEWCNDYYQENYNSEDVLNPNGPTKYKEDLRVVRGGSWKSLKNKSTEKSRQGKSSILKLGEIGCRCIWKKKP